MHESMQVQLSIIRCEKIFLEIYYIKQLWCRLWRFVAALTAQLLVFSDEKLIVQTHPLSVAPLLQKSDASKLIFFPLVLTENTTTLSTPTI